MIARFCIAELLLISMFHFSSSQDAACDSAFGATRGEALFGDKCAGEGDVSCPQACEDMFKDLHDTCAGKRYTTTVDEEDVVAPFKPSDLTSFYSVLDWGCKSSPALALVSRDDLTCEECLDVSSSFIYCNEGCPSLCMSILDKVYASCTASTEIVDEDGEVSTAEEIETTHGEFFRTDECNAYADTFRLGRRQQQHHHPSGNYLCSGTVPTTVGRRNKRANHIVAAGCRMRIRL